MTDPFLRYSLEKQRRIRVMLMVDGKLTQQNVTVLALEGAQALVRLGTKKAPVAVPLADILSCDYARGDHGEE